MNENFLIYVILKKNSKIVKTDTINFNAFKFIIGTFMCIKFINNDKINFKTKFFIGFHSGMDKTKSIFITNTWITRSDKKNFSSKDFGSIFLKFFIREIFDDIFNFYSGVWRESNSNEINSKKEVFIINLGV